MKKKKNKNKKRIPKTKAELIFKMRCNEVASKNAVEFVKGNISFEELLRKAYGVKEKPKTEENINEIL